MLLRVKTLLPQPFQGSIKPEKESSPQCTHPYFADGEDKPVIKELLDLHVKHPRYDYRRITTKLREKDWFINIKR